VCECVYTAMNLPVSQNGETINNGIWKTVTSQKGPKSKTIEAVKTAERERICLARAWLY
jgi:hypothetical protein